jgi:Gpi18-like mannosyltransferase
MFGNSPLIPASIAPSLAKSYIFYGIIFSIFFAVSIFLNVKRKYIVNIIIAGSLLILHLVVINFIG